MVTVSEIPQGLRARPRDRRGYPVPFTTAVMADGMPDFRVIDVEKVMKAATGQLCALSGRKLDRKKGAWLVGGPVSAFGPDNFYLDPPMDPENAEFALRTCPYLSMPKFAEKEFRAKGGGFGGELFSSPRVLKDRPSVFVAVHVFEWEVARVGPEVLFRAKRLYEAVSFWVHGSMVSHEEASALAPGMIPGVRDLPLFAKAMYAPYPGEAVTSP